MAFHLRKRRRVPRAPMNRPVQVQAGDNTLMGKGIETGIGGMSLWLDQPPEKGSMVTVSFSLPGSARSITAMSEVVWSQPRSQGKRVGRMGVRFVALPREERQEIRGFVNRLAKNYRDLHILLAMNEWKMERLKELTRRVGVTSYRDLKDLKARVAKAMDGFRS